MDGENTTRFLGTATIIGALAGLILSAFGILILSLFVLIPFWKGLVICGLGTSISGGALFVFASIVKDRAQ